ncbi:unnamed protein product [Larinioides sclopetarius]|uniref:Uncharacterized protein n=1 Tax=Larinioides sclopetarius TaxID=280406 RepID=A0AAV2A1X9_9ARAC
MKTSAMPRFELKHLAEFFWKSSSTKEEKTPIIKNAAKVPDNGSIAKESNMNGALESKSTYDSLIGSESNSGEEDPNGPPKMTLLRKLCFLLSLNGGVVYVAALLWWIPCRHPLCLSMQNWTVNISGQLTTNMEIKSTQLSTSVLFGIADDNGAHLASLEMANGTSSWNRSTDNILKNVFCDLDSFGDGTVNIPDCIVTAYNYIGAFNASNGTLLWERNITGPSDMTIRKVALAGKPSTGPLVMAISDEEMFLLMAENGTLISTLDLPCSWTLGLKLVGPWAAENVTAWTLVCEYGDSFEVWTFLEEEVLSLSEDFDEGPFRLLFRSIVSGHFTNPKEIQFAVTIQDGSNSTLHILESLNGSSEVTTSLGMRSVMSMEKIANGNRSVDTLVIESILPNEKKQNTSNFDTTPTTREYFTVKYLKKSAKFENIITADVYASAFSQLAEGAANLLIASQSPDSSTLLSRYVLISKLEDKCR